MHRVDGVDHLVSSRSDRSANGDDDAELRGARGLRGAGGVEHLVEVEEGIDVDVGGVAGRLRAERAVLGARARLRVDEALELHRGPAVLEAHAVGEGDEVGEVVEGERGHRVDLGPGQRAALVEQRGLGGGECGFHLAGKRTRIQL